MATNLNLVQEEGAEGQQSFAPSASYPDPDFDSFVGETDQYEGEGEYSENEEQPGSVEGEKSAEKQVSQKEKVSEDAAAAKKAVRLATLQKQLDALYVTQQKHYKQVGQMPTGDEVLKSPLENPTTALYRAVKEQNFALLEDVYRNDKSEQLAAHCRKLASTLLGYPNVGLPVENILYRLLEIGFPSKEIFKLPKEFELDGTKEVKTNLFLSNGKVDRAGIGQRWNKQESEESITDEQADAHAKKLASVAESYLSYAEGSSVALLIEKTLQEKLDATNPFKKYLKEMTEENGINPSVRNLFRSAWALSAAKKGHVDAFGTFLEEDLPKKGSKESKEKREARAKNLMNLLLQPVKVELNALLSYQVTDPKKRAAYYAETQIIAGTLTPILLKNLDTPEDLMKVGNFLASFKGLLHSFGTNDTAARREALFNETLTALKDIPKITSYQKREIGKSMFKLATLLTALVVVVLTVPPVNAWVMQVIDALWEGSDLVKGLSLFSAAGAIFGLSKLYAKFLDKTERCEHPAVEATKRIYGFFNENSSQQAEGGKLERAQQLGGAAVDAAVNAVLAGGM